MLEFGHQLAKLLKTVWIQYMDLAAIAFKHIHYLKSQPGYSL